MPKVIIAPSTPAKLDWPVGTVARVRLKGSTRNPDGYIRMHVRVGVPPGQNVNVDDPKTLATGKTRSAALNLATGSIKGDQYGIDKYDVLEVYPTVTVSK